MLLCNFKEHTIFFYCNDDDDETSELTRMTVKLKPYINECQLERLEIEDINIRINSK